jgi:hypothetical protein
LGARRVKDGHRSPRLLSPRRGFPHYRKHAKRDEEKRKILLELGLKRIEEKEKDDFIPVGYRRRKVKIISSA